MKAKVRQGQTKRVRPAKQHAIKEVRKANPNNAPPWWRDRFDARAMASHMTGTFMSD